MTQPTETSAGRAARGLCLAAKKILVLEVRAAGKQADVHAPKAQPLDEVKDLLMRKERE